MFYRYLIFRFVILLLSLSLNISIFAADEKVNTEPPPKFIDKEEIGYDEEDDEDEEEEEEKREVNYKTFDEEDIKFRRKLWREINLRENANEGFYYSKHEIVKFIIEGVEKGLLVPFTDFTKKKRMTKSQFKENLLEPSSSLKLEQEEEDFLGEKKAKTPKKPKHEYFFPHQVTILELEEELLFHGRRSEWSFDIKSIKLIIPQDLFETHISRDVGVFDFQELIKYLDSVPEALWRNDINASSHKKFSVAFKERLFSSVLRKVDNPKDLTIRQMYEAKSDEEALIASLKEEDKLINLMDKVWIP